MISFHNINSIAKYETKTLLRSWFFRIFAILSMVFLFFFNFGVLTQSGGGAGEWQIKALPSLIPYVNLLMLNVAQAIIAIFLASDFLKRDKKLDTTEVIYMRSMTNGEYVIGKTIGNLVVFLMLNILVLLIALVFNLAVGDVAVSWISYLNYFLLISVPTLVFIMGLSFLFMSVLRNQALTFIILLGYVALTLFYLQNKFYFVFDYMAFRVPLAYSDFVGFGNKSTLLVHRGIYFFLGLSFIFLTISFLKRLPQAKHFRQFSVVVSVLFFIAGVYLAWLHVSSVLSENRLRQEMLAINDSLTGEKAPFVKSYQIGVKHSGESIRVSSVLLVKNDSETNSQKLFFSLNPGFRIEKIICNGVETLFSRRQHLIELEPALAPGDSSELEFVYSGSVNEAACFLDVDDEKREEPYGRMMYQIDKRHAFITDNFVLLTRENNWYPVPGAGPGNTNKQWFNRQFSNFSMTVETKPGLVAISQGNSTPEDNKFTFVNKNPLSQISLVIGEYEKSGSEIDGLHFNLYVKPGHDYFSKFFEEIKDTIPSLIAESLQDFERTIDMYYPFETLSLVEVPVQFHSYVRIYSGEREPLQPEIILFPEKGVTVGEADFNGRFKRMQRYSRGDEANLMPAEQKVRVFQGFLGSFTQPQGRPNFSRSRGTFEVTETANEYYVFPIFYNHAYYISSDTWPVTNRIFESYLKQVSSDPRAGFMRSMQGTSEDEQANIALLGNSFAELLNDPEQITIIDNVIQLKGEALFSIIKRKAGDEAFDEFMYNFLSRNKFKTANIRDFNDEIKKTFDVDLFPYMENWFNSKELPAYLIGAVSAVEVLDKDQLKTMVKFKITNAEPVEGIVSVQFMTGGGGGGGRMSFGGPGSMTTVNKLVHLEGNETKQVSYLIDRQPRRITIKTLTSKNIPAELSFPFDNITEDKKAVPFEGEQVTDIPVRIAEDNEIILDNEDSGFSIVQPEEVSLLKKLLLQEEKTKLKYVGFNSYRPPRNWTATTNSNFYGRFIRSAYYTRSGEGDKKAVWKIPVPESGNYAVYANIAKDNRRGGGPGRREREEIKGEYEYTVHHDNGEVTALIDLAGTEEGWNNLGTFYFSSDSAVVELSNRSEARIVVADAVKIVKQ
ncbi:MAG: hypothetical protein RBS73_06745 [Prolixibacteraceae bacterium]|jgi:ABC-type transport system involved in multi-copper enzyme maturation permease subunit|nr:hypothetical protein [Prolixibacteraceae bacterium]